MAKRSYVNGSANRRKSNEGRKSKKHKERQNKRQSADIYTLPFQSASFDPSFEQMACNPRLTSRRAIQPLEAKTTAQKRYNNAIKNNCLTFGIGPAGTGKSYCAAALAADA